MQYPTPRKRREQVIRFRVRWCPRRGVGRSTIGRQVTEKAADAMQTTQNTMTNENNTRKKANAVFFSVIMVVSMVAVGFAGFAGSAAAVDTDDGDLTFKRSVELVDEEVTISDITATTSGDSADAEATAVVTYCKQQWRRNRRWLC